MKKNILLILFIPMLMYGSTNYALYMESMDATFLKPLGGGGSVGLKIKRSSSEVRLVDGIEARIGEDVIVVPSRELSWYSFVRMGEVTVWADDYESTRIFFVMLRFYDGELLLRDNNVLNVKDVYVSLVFRDSKYVGQLIRFEREGVGFSYYKEAGMDYCSNESSVSDRIHGVNNEAIREKTDPVENDKNTSVE